MKITVTEEDIKEGMQGIPSLCPVALAVRRTFGPEAPDGWPLHVDVGEGYVFVGEHRDIYLLPEPVNQWILYFDAGNNVHPIEFEIKRI